MEKFGLRRLFVCFLACLFFSVTCLGAQETSPTNAEQKTDAFINFMVKNYHLKRSALVDALSQAHYNQEVITKITFPYESKPWNVYRSHFVTEKRIEEGLAYWNKHQKVLNEVEKRYGIPASIIVAIIGVETNYGEHVGTYSALDALSTLAFYYPPRETFFTRELVQLFLLANEQKIPLADIKSSYAGAIGIPQFMPSAYRHYAVDYSKAGKIDLMSDNEDAIASVANYLNLLGWEKNQPIAATVSNQSKIATTLLSDKASPRFSLSHLKKNGIQFDKNYSPQLKAAVVALHNENGEEYWLTFHNFKVIMWYNPRIVYAMAVYQLSDMIEKARDAQHTPTSSTTASTRENKRSA